MKSNIGDLIAVIGVALAGTGIYMIYPPAAYIFWGVIVIWVGYQFDKQNGG